MTAGKALRFYTQEKRMHAHVPVYRWILSTAKALRIEGGTAFRGIESFGHDGQWHADHFFELQGDLPIEVLILTSEEKADRLLSHIRAAKLDIFYTETNIQFGTL